MRERLAAHGGSLQVETSPGSGFTVRLRLPMDGGVVVIDTIRPAALAADDDPSTQTRPLEAP